MLLFVNRRFRGGFRNIVSDAHILEILNGFHVIFIFYQIRNEFKTKYFLLKDIKAHYSQLPQRESPAVQQGIKHLNYYFLTYWIGEI